MDVVVSEKISELYAKYESNEYMLNRLNSHLLTILPNTLDLEHENYKERASRTLSLQTMQETFIKVFLDKHKYYYLYASGFYYEYLGDSFCVRKEDDIHYKLLSTISEDRTLMDWKYKTKFNILRQIKDRSVLMTTPNTATIQRVLSAIYPAFFPSKNAAKYFMTVVGDNILKKQTPIRIIHKHSPIFAEIDCIAYLIGATNLTNNFASKYNDNHTYTQYRLLQANDQFPDTWRNIIIQLNLDFVCVASHYSNRYGSSEGFLEHTADECLKTHILYLNNHSQDTIIEKFIAHSTQPADTSFKISWKQLHFIWKQYLNGETIPNMLYANALKQNLKLRLQYDEATDTFLNLTSKYLPNIRHFLNFCEENLIMSQTTPEFTNELELGELFILYASPTMKECELLKLIKHFFPEIVIDEYKYNKYILRTHCKLWDKSDGIVRTITHCREFPKSNIISIDDLYTEYIALTTGKLIVSKQYFEKYIRIHLKDDVVYETFIDFTTIKKIN